MTTPYQRFMTLMAQKNNNPNGSLNQSGQSNNQSFSVEVKPILSNNNHINNSFQQSFNQNQVPPKPQQITNNNVNIIPQKYEEIKQQKPTDNQDKREYFRQRINASPSGKYDNELLQKSEKRVLPSTVIQGTEFKSFNQIASSNKFDTSQLFKKGAPSFFGRGNFRGGSGGWNRNQRYSGNADVRKSGAGRESLLIFEMIGPETVAIQFQGFFDPTIKDTIKKVPGARYDPNSKEWTIKMNQKESLFQELAQTCLEKGIKISDTPEFAYNLVRTPIPFHNCKLKYKKVAQQFDYAADFKFKKNLDKLPEQLRDNLYDFQKQGILFGIEKHGRYLLGDEMGVGKTIQAICTAFLYYEEWPLFIVTPSSLKHSWKDEVIKWLPKFKSTDIQMFKKGSENFDPKCCIYIMSYDLASKKGDEIMEKQFKVAIADEAHYLKSRDAKRTKTLIPILTSCKRVILISGTPMISRPVEVFNILKILRPDIIDTFNEFAGRYCDPQVTPYAIDYSGNSATKELHYVLSRSIMIRRLKKDVLDQLPAKRRQKIEVETDKKKNNEIKNMLNGIMDDDPLSFLTQVSRQTTFDEYLTGLKGEQDDQKKNSFMQAYRLTGESKIQGVTEFMQNLIDNECKFLIFGHHQSVLDGLEQFAQQSKIGYIRIDGKVDADKRHERVKIFQSDDSVRIAILSITACSQGLTLTAASTVVFAELTWTPSIMNQAEDRAHRIGQQNSVNVYYLYGRDTMDDLIFQILSEKSQVVSDAIDGMATDYKIIKTNQDEILEEVKDLKSKGILNPVIVQTKKKKDQQMCVDDFFNKKSTLNDFVKKKNSKRRNKKKNQESESEDEEIEMSENSSEDQITRIYNDLQNKTQVIAPKKVSNDENEGDDGEYEFGLKSRFAANRNNNLNKTTANPLSNNSILDKPISNDNKKPLLENSVFFKKSSINSSNEQSKDDDQELEGLIEQMKHLSSEENSQASKKVKKTKIQQSKKRKRNEISNTDQTQEIIQPVLKVKKSRTKKRKIND